MRALERAPVGRAWPVVCAVRAAARCAASRAPPPGNRRRTTSPLRSNAKCPALLDALTSASLKPVINATGVILHTNLGRAPLAAAALERAAALGGYSNLEYDLASGGRGRRDVHAEQLLCRLTGAEAAVVVNNNAAATLMTLAALAAGREVIISRGELVEIGGGFRVPDVMAQSGAVLREVGTTNRTRAADYAAAIGDRTAAILRVHPSNFRIEGFTERPALDELGAIARQFNVLLIEDIGSGWIAGVPSPGRALGDEPVPRVSLAAGADVVLFSGDKLLGGPAGRDHRRTRDRGRRGTAASTDAGDADRQAEVRGARSNAAGVRRRARRSDRAGGAHDRDDGGGDRLTGGSAGEHAAGTRPLDRHRQRDVDDWRRQRAGVAAAHRSDGTESDRPIGSAARVRAPDRHAAGDCQDRKGSRRHRSPDGDAGR